MFDLRLDRIAEWINANGYERVSLQLPEGLKCKAADIVDHIISNTSASVTILGDPCYGACDIRNDGNALIHFGHSRIPSQDDGGNVLYIEARANIEFKEFEVPSEFPKKIGLLAAIQYVGLIPKTKEFLESKGKKVFVGNGDGRIAYPGQVLGCNCTALSADADAFLYIGEGDFHPLAAALGTRKSVYVLDPMALEIKNMDAARDRMLRRRFAATESAKDAKRFVIIVCSKPGQKRSAAAEDAKLKIRKSGRTSYEVIMDEITPERLMHYDADAFVNTGCPRISMDESARFKGPMLTPPELDIALGLRPWEEYEFDQIRS